METTDLTSTATSGSTTTHTTITVRKLIGEAHTKHLPLTQDTFYQLLQQRTIKPIPADLYRCQEDGYSYFYRERVFYEIWATLRLLLMIAVWWIFAHHYHHPGVCWVIEVYLGIWLIWTITQSIKSIFAQGNIYSATSQYINEFYRASQT